MIVAGTCPTRFGHAVDPTIRSVLLKRPMYQARSIYIVRSHLLRRLAREVVIAHRAQELGRGHCDRHAFPYGGRFRPASSQTVQRLQRTGQPSVNPLNPPRSEGSDKVESGKIRTQMIDFRS